MIETILEYSEVVRNDRTPKDVMLKLMEEVGELSTEIAISNGMSNKEEGDDGILGEAVDAIVCLVDIIRLHRPDITIEELDRLAYAKCNKWFEGARKLANK